ncbi:hypothetical protein DYB25_008045 [Aphanomyces astaci]|uniref:Prolyl 4-hydroxylase alpha subunit domain-containing protein n=1 Tax=Aphanomyces astaci TaxID=112090 RepID=A0A397ADV1_APHAT|nr:hypothetical protein DYB25_008045 [Aphanomyces astaci]
MQSPRNSRGNLTLANATSAPNYGSLSKYETDIVAMDDQFFLEPRECTGTMPTVLSSSLHFFWDGDGDCLHVLARTAGLALGIPALRLDNGVRLSSQYSLPLTTSSDVEAANRIVHVLLDFDLWVWPGIAVNFTYTLHDNMTLTTQSLSPRVFSVTNFINQGEAGEIIAHGRKLLRRSPTGESVDGTVSDIRTSNSSTGRRVCVARLPSASYAERLQLVRYRPGEFYRQHLDTMASKNIEAPPVYQYADFVKWAAVAAKNVAMLGNDLPQQFKPGQALYPNAKNVKFASALVELFWKDGVSKHFFASRNEMEWERWLADKVARPRGNPMRQLLQHDGLSHFLRWIRWAKERISVLGDQVPASIRPNGKLYPKYDQYFQYELIALLFKHHSTSQLTDLLSKQWFDFLVEYQGRRDCIHILLQQVPALAQSLADTWAKEVQMYGEFTTTYTLPRYVHHMTPNRFVTLFVYLNSVERGSGGTVFPFAESIEKVESVRSTTTSTTTNGMAECKTGLNVAPTAFGASLFYTQTPDQDVDFLALHGGCPPQGSIKWGANAFMWNADAAEGADFWN